MALINAIEIPNLFLWSKLQILKLINIYLDGEYYGFKVSKRNLEIAKSYCREFVDLKNVEF